MTAVAAKVESRGCTDAAPLVAGILDAMDVTERAYHQLVFGAPLVVDLTRRAQRLLRPGGSVLLVGGNSLLAESLAALGCELEMWRLPGTYLTEAAAMMVSGTVVPESLPEVEAPGKTYDLVVLPLVIEALPRAAALKTLRGLRGLLAPDGHLLLATSNHGRLESRLAAACGQPLRHGEDTATISLGWPSPPTARIYHRDELVSLGREAGFGATCAHVTGEQPFMEMELLSVAGYARRKLGRAVKLLLPSTRDALVLECTPRIGDRDGAAGQSPPTVSVFVSVRSGGEALVETLESLRQQTYPSGLYEVIVLDDGRVPDVAEAVARVAAAEGPALRRLRVSGSGPADRMAAIAAATTTLSGHTDDSCLLPEDWIESAVTWFDNDTAVVTGPVFGRGGTVSRQLEVPGTRPDPDEKGVPSEVLFPITNVFYRNRVVLAAAGLGAGLTGNGSGPGLGWDTELAWRLQRLGWRARFREEVRQFRSFPPDAIAVGWAGRQFRQASQTPHLMKAAPEYAAATLTGRVFASRQTMYFDLALAAITLGALRRGPGWLLLVLPWLGTISSRVDLWPVRAWPGSLRSVMRIGLRQFVWLAGFVIGSIRARRIVL